VLKRTELGEAALWRLECDLVFRWRYCADRLALETLLERFEPLIRGVASERYTTCQLDKGFVTPRDGSAPPAGVFEDLLAEGRLGLIEAANQFDGRNRFATYARAWIFKRMQEFVRFNWNVVRQPEPAEWKVSKEDQIPRTHPSPGMNPFENPLNIDKKTKNQRHVSYSTPVDNDGSRSPEEWVIGRFHVGTEDCEHKIYGARHFESEEFQAAAHQNTEAEEHAFEVETLGLTLDARILELSPKEQQVIRARYPWAIDVEGAPRATSLKPMQYHDEEELGEYLRGRQICFPKKHTRSVIGDALGGITAEAVRKIENRTKEKMRGSKTVSVCCRRVFWGVQAYWNRSKLKAVETHRAAPTLPAPQPDSDEPLVDDLVRLMGVVLRQSKRKRWLVRSISGQLFNPILYEEPVVQGLRNGKKRFGSSP
jgi:RNA polymerase sigma factor (sigma-70 family)